MWKGGGLRMRSSVELFMGLGAAMKTHAVFLVVGLFLPLTALVQTATSTRDPVTRNSTVSDGTGTLAHSGGNVTFEAVLRTEAFTIGDLAGVGASLTLQNMCAECKGEGWSS